MSRFNIYIESDDIRKILNTLQKQNASQRGKLFSTTNTQPLTDHDRNIMYLYCAGAYDCFCRLIFIQAGQVVEGVDLTMKDLEHLLNDLKISIKVKEHLIDIRVNDSIEYEEICPHCGHEVYGVVDKYLVSTCSNCSKEIMVCSRCPTCCGMEDADCENCIHEQMDCSFGCNCNSGDGCYMKLLALKAHKQSF